jgi:hypothetical protein
MVMFLKLRIVRRRLRASGAITESCGWGVRERRILSIKKRNNATSLEDAKKKGDAPVPENKVVSLEERAKDEQKPFLEQLMEKYKCNTVAICT